MINDTEEKQILQKVPSDRKLLLKYIDSIVTNQKKIKNIKKNICDEVSLPLISSTNRFAYTNLIKSFNKWIQNAPVIDKIKRVRDDKDLKWHYNFFQKNLNAGIKAANGCSSDAKTFIDEAKPIIKSFLKATAPEANMVEDMENALFKVYSNQNKIIAHLRGVLQTLLEYHIKRCNWAEFLMGMRNTPLSDGSVHKIELDLSKRLNLLKMGSKSAKALLRSKSKK